MRIQASIEYMNREVNMKTKAACASISLGKKPTAQDDPKGKDPKVFMMISTANNRAGIKFAIRQNLSKVFDKFAHEGRCTISLINPPKDIFISKANAVQLKAFVKMLKTIFVAKSDKELDEITLTAAALNPATSTQVTKPKEKMVILNKIDYPITKSFPNTLTELRINGINLKKFDSRILRLKHLVVLDLCDNSLENIPESFASLTNLKELHLANNKIGVSPPKFFMCTTLSQNLCLLDLSNNQLKMLPNHISNFKKLVTLKIVSNDLRKLGMNLDRLSSLKRLELIGNEDLKVFPGSLPKLRLDHLSLSAKCLTEENEGIKLHDNSQEIPTLEDLCVKRCSELKLRSKLDELEMPYRILEKIDFLQRCQCGQLIHSSSNARGITRSNPNRIAQTFVSDGGHAGSQTFIRCETFFCSTSCLELFKNRPLNFR